MRPPTSTGSGLRSAVVVGLLASVLGVVLCSLATSRGLLISEDSRHYLEAAESIARGSGIEEFSRSTGGQFPPGYPYLLAVLLGLGLSLSAGVIVVNVAAVAVMTFATALLVREVGLSLLFVVAGSVFVAVNPNLIEMSTAALSDLPAAALTTTAALLIVIALRGGPHAATLVLLSSLTIAAATMLRFAVSFFVPVLIGASWWVFTLLRRPHALTKALAFGALACSGLVIVVLRNVSVGMGYFGFRQSSALDWQGAVLDSMNSMGQLLLPRSTTSLTLVVGTTVTVAVAFTAFQDLRTRRRGAAVVGAFIISVGLLTLGASAVTRLDIGTTRFALPLLPLVVVGVARWASLSSEAIPHYVDGVLPSRVTAEFHGRAVQLARITWGTGVVLGAFVLVLANLKATFRLFG